MPKPPQIAPPGAPPADDGAKPPPSRRLFLQRMAFVGGGVILGASCRKPGARPGPPAPEPMVRPPWLGAALASPHHSFTAEEYATVCAACERIVPRDQDPGAIDAGVPDYIDRMLTDPELHEMRDVFKGGIVALGALAKARFHGRFAELPAAAQDELLGQFRDAPEGSGKGRFFETLLVLTMEGLLGDPSYGGNRDRAGWALVGFDTSMPGHYHPRELGAAAPAEAE
ncbi:MAG: gluconate 2-dehydrogenase subunit 3 family protein [Deltaproteobacteria bacterium]